MNPSGSCTGLTCMGLNGAVSSGEVKGLPAAKSACGSGSQSVHEAMGTVRTGLVLIMKLVTIDDVGVRKVAFELVMAVNTKLEPSAGGGGGRGAKTTTGKPVDMALPPSGSMTRSLNV